LILQGKNDVVSLSLTPADLGSSHPTEKLKLMEWAVFTGACLLNQFVWSIENNPERPGSSVYGGVNLNGADLDTIIALNDVFMFRNVHGEHVSESHHKKILLCAVTLLLSFKDDARMPVLMTTLSHIMDALYGIRITKDQGDKGNGYESLGPNAEEMLRNMNKAFSGAIQTHGNFMIDAHRAANQAVVGFPARIRLNHYAGSSGLMLTVTLYFRIYRHFCPLAQLYDELAAPLSWYCAGMCEPYSAWSCQRLHGSYNKEFPRFPHNALFRESTNVLVELIMLKAVEEEKKAVENLGFLRGRDIRESKGAPRTDYLERKGLYDDGLPPFAQTVLDEGGNKMSFSPETLTLFTEHKKKNALIYSVAGMIYAATVGETTINQVHKDATKLAEKCGISLTDITYPNYENGTTNLDKLLRKGATSYRF